MLQKHIEQFGALQNLHFEELHKSGKPIGQDQPTLDFIKLIYDNIKAVTAA
jgi:hypothetical protein